MCERSWRDCQSDGEASRSPSSHIKSIDITLAQTYLTELGLSRTHDHGRCRWAHKEGFPGSPTLLEVKRLCWRCLEAERSKLRPTLHHPRQRAFWFFQERFQTNCSLFPPKTLATEAAAELLSPRLTALHKHQTCL